MNKFIYMDKFMITQILICMQQQKEEFKFIDEMHIIMMVLCI